MTKAIFFDIDGTLVSFKTHKVPQSTIDALDTLRKNGIKVFVASGRHKLSINNLGDLQFDGYVTLNGSIALINNQVIYKHCIPDKDIDALTEYLETKESFPCVYVQENDLYMNYHNKTTRDIFKLLNFPEPPMRPLTERNGSVFQVIAFFEKEQEEHIMKLLPDCDETRWNPLFTDIVPKGSSKWIGISKVLEHFDIKQDETIAFGDGGNDIEMLKTAHVGIAMGNANNDVKQAADYVTDSVDDNGIANALKHFGLI